LLDDGRDKSSKLWFLPSLLVRQFDMDEVEPLECMILLNATIQVDATMCASMALDDGVWIDDFQLVSVGYDLDILNRNNADKGEESPCWLPALRTSAYVIVKNVASDGHLYSVGPAMAV